MRGHDIVLTVKENPTRIVGVSLDGKDLAASEAGFAGQAHGIALVSVTLPARTLRIITEEGNSTEAARPSDPAGDAT